MIVYNNARFWQQPLFISVVGAGVLGVAAWAWFGQGSLSSDAVTSTSAPADGSSPFGSVSPQSAGNAAQNTAMPSDSVRPDDWKAIQGAMKKAGFPDAEAQRVVSYLGYQRHFEAWQGLDGTKDVQHRKELAKDLLAELPDRVSRNEFTPAEANLMAGVLLAEVEPDEAKRQQQIESMMARFISQIGQPDDEQAMQTQERAVEAQRKVVTAVAEWQAQSADLRTQATLEQALDKARR